MNVICKSLYLTSTKASDFLLVGSLVTMAEIATPTLHPLRLNLEQCLLIDVWFPTNSVLLIIDKIHKIQQPPPPPLLNCSYVIRRILRRGVRYCTEKLGAKPGMFASLVPVVVEILVRIIYLALSCRPVSILLRICCLFYELTQRSDGKLWRMSSIKMLCWCMVD